MTSVILSVYGGFQGTLKWLKIEQQKRKEAVGFLEETWDDLVIMQSFSMSRASGPGIGSAVSTEQGLVREGEGAGMRLARPPWPLM